jgi:multisubunit Na+/H+ antiporter MnhE subunit
MRRLIALVKLFGWFAWGVVASGTHTTWLILSGPRRPKAMLVRIRFAPMSEAGVAVFASMLSLTPGSTVVDVDLEKREFLLHLLDGANAARLTAGMRSHFEGPLTVLFGTESA